MSTVPAEHSELFRSISPLTRILHRNAPLHELLIAARAAGNLPITFANNQLPPDVDYAQVDPALTIAPELDAPPPNPPHGLSYSGFSPEQRRFFLEWLKQPTQPAESTYKLLHLAHIETWLFEQSNLSNDARTILRYLQETESWSDNIALSRSMLLSLWLQQDSEQLLQWIESGRAHAHVLGIALGQAALLGQILTPKLLAIVMRSWGITSTLLSDDLARAQLASLTDTLEVEPLAHALAQLGDDAPQPEPWRAAHRDLRIAIPQPDLRPVLEPLLHEAKNISEQTTSHPATNEPEEETQDESGKSKKWSLVLAFQQSRSEYFDFALHKARQRPGYTQIMDENRQIVYRITFQKNEMRHFWQLWEYVQNWSGTEVFVNGKVVEKWKVWPYSQYLR